MTLYTLRCKVTGETQQVVVCDEHAIEMARTTALESDEHEPADHDCECEFCC